MKTLLTLASLAGAIALAGVGHPPQPITTPAGLPAPVTDADFYDAGRADAAKVELGRLLFFDKVLSGNQNVACATCHHPTLGTSDGVSLGLGEGPIGLGPERRPGDTAATSVQTRVPRNAPALFNLGAREFERMFHDGRVETDPNGYYEGGFVTPAKWKLPAGLDNVLAAQAMFPVTSHAEMTGQKGENEIADAMSLNNAAGPGGVWEILAARLRSYPEYVAHFRRAFPAEVEDGADITYVLAANAIAAFEASAFRADQSPYDAHLRGDQGALSRSAARGMALFYGAAGCADCHSGKFQTDHDFHAIAMPQIGPGKGDGNNADYWSASGERAFLEDFGRGRVTVRPEDDFEFRTPSLRNVELTAPYGHAGSYPSLEAVVRHHLDPVASLEGYALGDDTLPAAGRIVETAARHASWRQASLSDSRQRGFELRDDFVQGHPELRARIAAANELAPRSLGDDQIEDLVAFLASLTDPSSRDLAHLVPERVPSGLPVAD